MSDMLSLTRVKNTKLASQILLKQGLLQVTLYLHALLSSSDTDTAPDYGESPEDERMYNFNNRFLLSLLNFPIALLPPPGSSPASNRCTSISFIRTTTLR